FCFDRPAKQTQTRSGQFFYLSPEPQNRPFQSPDRPHALHAAGGTQPAWQSLHNDPIRIESSHEKNASRTSSALRREGLSFNRVERSIFTNIGRLCLTWLWNTSSSTSLIGMLEFT